MAIQRGSTWQANVRLRDGTRVRPGGFNSQADAELWEAQARVSDAKGEKLPPVSTCRTSLLTRMDVTLTLGDLRRRVLEEEAPVGWKGSKDYDGSYERSAMVVKFFGADKAVEEITLAEVDRFTAALRKIGNSVATINRKLASLSKMLVFAQRRGLLTKMPPYIERRKEGGGRIRWLQQAEEDKLLAALETAGQHDVRQLMIFLLDTGARLGEAFKLRWPECSSTGASFLDTKGGIAVDRTVPLTARAKAALKCFEDNTLDGPFHGMKYTTVKAAFDAAARRAKLGDDVVIHTLRHTCATRLALAGWDPGRLKLWMGHSSYETTERYIKLRADALKGMEASLEERTESAYKPAADDVSKSVPKRAQVYPLRSRAA